MIEQSKRYKIVEKKQKVNLNQSKNPQFSKKQKIAILIIFYLLCCAVIIGLVFAIMY